MEERLKSFHSYLALSPRTSLELRTCGVRLKLKTDINTIEAPGSGSKKMNIYQPKKKLPIQPKPTATTSKSNSKVEEIEAKLNDSSHRLLEKGGAKKIKVKENRVEKATEESVPIEQVTTMGRDNSPAFGSPDGPSKSKKKLTGGSKVISDKKTSPRPGKNKN